MVLIYSTTFKRGLKKSISNYLKLATISIVVNYIHMSHTESHTVISLNSTTISPSDIDYKEVKVLLILHRFWECLTIGKHWPRNFN
jgi:hypothetical protein